MDNIQKAIQLVDKGKTEQALELLRQFEKEATDDEKFTIAELYTNWGFQQEARMILEDLLELYPDETDLKLALADIFIEMEEDELAITFLNEIKEDDDGYVQALVQLADLYQAQGLFEVSEQKLLQAKQIDPNEILIDFALGELYFSIGEFNKAINYYEKVVSKEKELAGVSVMERLSEAYAAAGEYEKALEHFKEMDDNNADQLFKYGVTAYQADRSDIARKAWEHVLELDADYHTVYYQLAKVYEDEGQTEKAYETAKKGLERDSFNKELYFMTGSLAHQLDDNEASEKYIREAIALEPDYKEAIIFLIELLKVQDSHFDIAELLQSIQNAGADDPQYDWELAKALNEMENFEDAFLSYQNAYIPLKEDSDFLKEFGYFLTEDGKITEAIRIFDEYLQLEPLDEDIQAYKDRLEAARETDF